MSGQIKILGGQTAGAMGRETQGHLVIVNHDIRMVIGFLGEFAYLIHEGQSFFEVAQSKLFLDRFGLSQLPAGETTQLALDLSL